jgi:hypothetical protein
LDPGPAYVGRKPPEIRLGADDLAAATKALDDAGMTLFASRPADRRERALEEEVAPPKDSSRPDALAGGRRMDPGEAARRLHGYRRDSDLHVAEERMHAAAEGIVRMGAMHPDAMVLYGQRRSLGHAARAVMRHDEDAFVRSIAQMHHAGSPQYGRSPGFASENPLAQSLRDEFDRIEARHGRQAAAETLRRAMERAGVEPLDEDD